MNPRSKTMTALDMDEMNQSSTGGSPNDNEDDDQEDNNNKRLEVIYKIYGKQNLF